MIPFDPGSGQHSARHRHGAPHGTAPTPDMLLRFLEAFGFRLSEAALRAALPDPLPPARLILMEAIEIVQACGLTASQAHQLVDDTYGPAVPTVGSAHLQHIGTAA